MIWKRKKRPNFPKETLGYDDYYIVSLEDIAQLEDENVKFVGTLTEKPIIQFYSAGWPWSFSSRLIEEDHGHRSLFKIKDVTVYFKGPLHIKRGEKITVWGKVKNGAVQAKIVEGEDIIYQS